MFPEGAPGNGSPSRTSPSRGTHVSAFNTNVLILGKTGSGKSALVNYLYGRNIAIARAGKPVTERGLHRHPPFLWNDMQVSVFDSWGLESNRADVWKEDLYAAMRDSDQSQNIADWFHFVIYCCDARKSRPAERAPGPGSAAHFRADPLGTLHGSPEGKHENRSPQSLS